MFERAVFRSSNWTIDFDIDLGRLAEALLFYGDVELLLDRANLSGLLKAVGPGTLIRLVRTPGVRAHFVDDATGAATENNGFTTHSFLTFSAAANEKRRPFQNKEEKIEEIFRRALGNTWPSRKQARFIAQFVEEASFGAGLAGVTLMSDAKRDVFDRDYLHKGVGEILREKIPHVALPSQFRFQAVEFDGRFLIDTDLDFSVLEREYEKIWPRTHSSLTPAAILVEILEGRVALGLGSNLKGDVIASDITSKLLKLRVDKSVANIDSTRRQINMFEEYALNGKNVRDAINIGGRSLDEFLDLLEGAGKFKKWIAGRSDDQDLAKDYVNELGSTGWLNTLPAKMMRYLVFSGASLLAGAALSPVVGAVTGLGLGVADNFLVDRMIGGWKPNHFVSRDLKKFLP